MPAAAAPVPACCCCCCCCCAWGGTPSSSCATRQHWWRCYHWPGGCVGATTAAAAAVAAASCLLPAAAGVAAGSSAVLAQLQQEGRSPTPGIHQGRNRGRQPIHPMGLCQSSITCVTCMPHVAAAPCSTLSPTSLLIARPRDMPPPPPHTLPPPPPLLTCSCRMGASVVRPPRPDRPGRRRSHSSTRPSRPPGRSMQFTHSRQPAAAGVRALLRRQAGGRESAGPSPAPAHTCPCHLQVHPACPSATLTLL